MADTPFDRNGLPDNSKDRVFVDSTGMEMVCPVRIGLKRDGSDLWTMPLEPLVSVRASKTVIRRNIAKAAGSGTVKEQWNQDDYEISIEGVFISNTDGEFPEVAVSKLQKLLKKGQSLTIHCRLLDVVGVNLICVTGWEFPATPGVENQQFSITAYSDSDFDLII